MLEKLKLKSEFSKNVLTLMTGTTIAQAIPIAISPILTRLYTPEDFGVFAFYVSLISIFSVVATGRYEMAIMLPKNKNNALQILLIVIMSAFIFSLLLFLLFLLLFFNDTSYSFLNHYLSMQYFLTIPIIVFLIASFQGFNYFNNRYKRYKRLSKSKVIQSFSTSIFNITFGFLFSNIGLIISYILGQLIATSYIFFKTLKEFSLNRKTLSLKRVFVLIKKYKEFPIINMPHAFLNIFSTNIPIIMMSYFFNNTIIGFYALATKVILSPVGIITSSYSQVFLQKIIELKQKANKKEEMLFFKSTIFKLLLFSFPFFLIFFFISKDIFTIVFGKEWVEAGLYAQILIPMLYVRFTGSIVSSIVIVYNRQKKALVLEIINTILRILAFIIGGIMNDIVIGLILFSLFSSLVTIYRLTWYIKIINKG